MLEHHAVPPFTYPAQEPRAPEPSGPRPPAGDTWDLLSAPSGMLVSGLWVLAGIVLLSLWGEDLFGLTFLLMVGWVLMGVGFALFAVAVAIVSVWAAAQRNFRRSLRLGLFLLPLVLALGTMEYMLLEQIPLRARFEMSESELNDIADAAERGGQRDTHVSQSGGLFDVDRAYLRNDCIHLVTGTSLASELGLARCRSEPDTDYVWGIRYDHLEGSWWKWSHYD